MFSFNHRALLPVLFLLVSSACQRLEFDPNQSVNLHSAERVNLAAINQLRIQPNPDSIIRIGVIGDSHIDYENTEELVEALNAVPGLDLVVHTGDLTEHGIFQEFDWKVDYLSQLTMPYLAVVGNHDLVAKGKSVYQNMFGPTDFSFILQRTKFIFFDSNSREYGFQENIPNLGWLERELQPGEDSLFSAVVLVSHVPYFDLDFDQSKRDAYTRLLNQTHRRTPILASLNGHMHNGFEVANAECLVPHLGPGSANKRGFFIVEIQNGKMRYEKRVL